MATIAQQGDPDLAAIINGSGSNGTFQVGDDSSSPPTLMFSVDSQGDVLVKGSIFRNDSTPVYVDNDNLSGAGTVVRLADDTSTPDVRLLFEVVSDGVRIRPQNTGDALSLKGSEVRFLRSGSGDVAEFEDAGGGVAARITTTALLAYRGSDETIRLEAVDANDDDRLVLGNPGGEVRGQVYLHRDDTSSAERQGILQFVDENGDTYSLWVDTAGKLRIYNGDPGTSDTAGAVIGP